MLVAASLLSANFADLKNEIKKVEDYIDYFHLDVMDGHFVPNISFGIPVIKSIRSVTNKVFDTHLMISNPKEYILEFSKISDIITFHFEAVDNPLEVINLIKSYNCKAGISVKPNTSIEVLNPYLDMLDLVLVMSVEPGFGGQSFLNSALDKIEYLSNLKKKNNYNYLIEVDGGINDLTKKLVEEKGCEIVVAGSYIFGNDNYLERIGLLK